MQLAGNMMDDDDAATSCGGLGVWGGKLRKTVFCFTRLEGQTHLSVTVCEQRLQGPLPPPHLLTAPLVGR